MTPKVLLLFVHGFLGSESSFASFPLDLVHQLRTLYSLKDIEARIFPFFETKGDPERAINLLSMGGLIAADAFRKLVALKKNDDQSSDSKKSKHLSIASVDVRLDDIIISPATGTKESAELDKGLLKEEGCDPARADEKVEDETAPSWFANWWGTKPTDKDSPALDDVPVVTGDILKAFPVEAEAQQTPINSSYPPNTESLNYTPNIIAILCFDSPFYGLSSTVFTRGVGDHSSDIISSYVPTDYAESVNSTLKYTSQVTADAVEALPSLALATVNSIPAATSTVVSSVLLPVTDPRKAAGLVLYPITQLPTVLGSIGSLASSYLQKSAVADPLTSDNEVLADFRKKVDEAQVEYEPKVSLLSFEDSIPKEPEVIGTPPLPTRPDLLPIPSNTDWTAWIGIGLSTAALATGYYYSGGLLAIAGSSYVRRAAIGYGISNAEIVRQHLSFLYPIWGETRKACEERMQVMIDKGNDGTFMFKCYYVVIPRETGDAMVFISKPPLETEYLFRAVGSDFTNVIGAHMSLFSREQNPGYYWHLINETGKDIKNLVMRLRQPAL